MEHLPCFSSFLLIELHYTSFSSLQLVSREQSSRPYYSKCVDRPVTLASPVTLTLLEMQSRKHHSRTTRSESAFLHFAN